MSNCYNCGKPPVYEMPVENGKMLLCLDCYSKVHAIQQQQLASNINHMNYLTGMMDATAGISGMLPRYEVPTPINVVNKGDTNYNNINVESSVVGVINQGEVGSIDVAMSNIGDPQAVVALKEFTEAILNDKELEEVNKHELLEQLSYLASQVAMPKDQRKPSIVRTVLTGVTTSVGATALMSSWKTLQPILEKIVFGS